MYYYKTNKTQLNEKKLFIQLLLFFTSFLTLYSCIHDDINTASDLSSKEYENKSLWKQDEKYIKNVMQVYQKNEDKIKKTSGTPYWDYASTLESFDETFVMVPIVEAGRVISVMQVPRHGSKIRFYFTNFQSQIDFFQALVFAKYKKASDASSETNKSIVCKTVSVAVWLPDSESNPDPDSGAGHWGVHSVIKCKQVLDNCSGVVGPDGQCITGGNTDDPGEYPYPGGGGNPETPETPVDTPCEKLKSQTSSPIFTSNITNLEGKTGNTSESGFRIGTNADGSMQNQELENKLGTQQVDLQVFSNTVTVMHTHFDGLIPMFSPGDVIFFNKWIMFAKQWNAVPTNNPKIPLNNLTFTIVTSDGNYSLTFDGSDVVSLPNYTQEQFDDLNQTYEKNLIKAITKSNVGGNILVNNNMLEKEFLKFVSKQMNMSGVKLFKTASDGNTELELVNGNLNRIKCP